MTRLGYSTTITIDNTQFSQILAFLASLTTWSVKGSWTVGTPGSVSERNYIVIQHNTTGDEVFIYVPNGADSDMVTGIHLDYRETYVTANDRCIGFSYMPGGGYSVSGDPLTSAYWDPSVKWASPVMAMEGWWEGSAQHHCYMIEDNSEAFFCFYNERNDSSTWLGQWMAGENVNDILSNFSASWSNHGLFYVNPALTGSPPAIDNSVFRVWSPTIPNSVGQSVDVSGFNLLSGITGNQPHPFDSKYITSNVPLFPFGVDVILGKYPGIPLPALWMGRVNINYLRFTTRVTSTFKTIRGNDQVNIPFIHLYRDYWSPWANGLAFL